MIEVIIEVHEGISLKPAYHTYSENAWANINICTDCSMVGLYEDMHETTPCPNCGGRVKRNGVGKFSGKEVATGWFHNDWTDGKWQIRKGVK